MVGYSIGVDRPVHDTSGNVAGADGNMGIRLVMWLFPPRRQSCGILIGTSEIGNLMKGRAAERMCKQRGGGMKHRNESENENNEENENENKNTNRKEIKNENVSMNGYVMGM